MPLMPLEETDAKEFATFCPEPAEVDEPVVWADVNSAADKATKRLSSKPKPLVGYMKQRQKPMDICSSCVPGPYAAAITIRRLTLRSWTLPICRSAGSRIVPRTTIASGVMLILIRSRDYSADLLPAVESEALSSPESPSSPMEPSLMGKCGRIMEKMC